MVFDADDESDLLFFGHVPSYLLRHPDILEEEVMGFDLENKTISVSHVYE